MMLRNLTKRLLPLLLALLLLAGCAGADESLEAIDFLVGTNGGGVTEDTVPSSSPIIIAVDPPTPDIAETDGEIVSTSPDPGAGKTLPPPDQTPFRLAEDGEYTRPEDVADYLHFYGRLPGNFITKKEAQALGWPGGDLWKYAPGKSLGGDYFGNYEGLLPEGSYHECDVNYNGGSRGAERLIYDADGGIWYTADHYVSFTQLY